MSSSPPPTNMYWGSSSSPAPPGVSLSPANGSPAASAFLMAADYNEKENSDQPNSPYLFPPGADDEYGEEGDGDYKEYEDYEDYDDEGEEYDEENNALHGTALHGTAPISSPQPLMDPNFYHGVESLLSAPPPAFSFGGEQADRKSKKAIADSKKQLRKMENMSVGSSINSNVGSKIDTGNAKRQSKSKGNVAVPGAGIDSDLLAQAFQYADRIAAQEALGGCEGDVADTLRAQVRRGEGVAAGNPMQMVRKVRERQGNGGGGNQEMRRSKSAGTTNNPLGAPNGAPNGATKKKNGGKKKMNKSGMVYGANPAGADEGNRGSGIDMESALANMMGGGEAARLRAELEESKRRMEGHSDVLRDAAGSFLQNKFK